MTRAVKLSWALPTNLPANHEIVGIEIYRGDANYASVNVLDKLGPNATEYTDASINQTDAIAYKYSAHLLYRTPTDPTDISVPSNLVGVELMSTTIELPALSVTAEVVDVTTSDEPTAKPVADDKPADAVGVVDAPQAVEASHTAAPTAVDSTYTDPNAR